MWQEPKLGRHWTLDVIDPSDSETWPRFRVVGPRGQRAEVRALTPRYAEELAARLMGCSETEAHAIAVERKKVHRVKKEKGPELVFDDVRFKRA
jgi:hypothetical protein